MKHSNFDTNESTLEIEDLNQCAHEDQSEELYRQFEGFVIVLLISSISLEMLLFIYIIPFDSGSITRAFRNVKATKIGFPRKGFLAD